MALIRCYECGGECSTSAKKCPACGSRNPGLGRWGNRLLNLMALILMPFVLLAVGLLFIL